MFGGGREKMCSVERARLPPRDPPSSYA